VFYEVLGLPRDRAEQALVNATGWLAAHAATSTCRPGLSPHAPYSVRASLFSDAARLAGEYAAPLATHLAETEEELELLRDHAGPFKTFLQELGVWDPEGLVEHVGQVMERCVMAGGKLLVHGNHLGASAVIPAGSTIVYCPRTHAAFGHRPHPFREFLAHGVNVALGTDSLASNPDLDLLGEARFLHRNCPDFPADAVLRMATLNGAEALGWSAETGSLTPGKSADLVAVPLPNEEADDPHTLLLESALAVTGVMYRGRWLEGMPLGHSCVS
jgi:cytosine/adenosine deaminase-related metal-dependent hydrolase